MIDPVSLPPAVEPGDTVGVAALSGPVDPARLENGLAELGLLGFEAHLAPNLASAQGYLAGDDEERLAAFHELAADPEIRAIFFARGGYGVMRLLDRLDWDLLAAHPRAYVGYSDLTPFLHEVVRRLGVAAFHGPMVAADFARGMSQIELGCLLAALAGEVPFAFPVEGWLRRGSAEGPLLGGCLSMLAAVAGTPHQPDLDGAILFLEDVNEPLYRLDRMLTQLRLSGMLAGVAGVVVGHVDLAASNGVRRSEEPALLRALLSDRLSGPAPGMPGGVKGPVAVGLPCGHSAPNLTLPLGLRARLDASSGLLVGVS